MEFYWLPTDCSWFPMVSLTFPVQHGYSYSTGSPSCWPWLQYFVTLSFTTKSYQHNQTLVCSTTNRTSNTFKSHFEVFQYFNLFPGLLEIVNYISAAWLWLQKAPVLLRMINGYLWQCYQVAPLETHPKIVIFLLAKLLIFDRSV